MSAVMRNLYVEQGATFYLAFTYATTTPSPTPGQPPVVGAPYDLSGCTAAMQLRRSVEGEVVIALTSADGITLNATFGIIEIRITDEKTDALGILGAKLVCVYDFELNWPSGDVTRLLQGKVTISPNVTRV